MRTLFRFAAVAGTAGLCGAIALACSSDTRGRHGSYGDSGGSGGSSGSGSGSAASSSGAPAPTAFRATGVTINEIALYQGVKRPLMLDGKPATTNIPIVAGRDALIRVFVSLDATYANVPVTAELTVGDADPPLSVTQSLSGSSDEASLGSTFNFDVPGAMIPNDFHYSVRLTQAVKSDGGIFSYPVLGSDAVGAIPSGASLKVQIVPVKYGADGSNRVPDTSQAIQDMYRDGYFGNYPVPAVEISLHAPVQWNQTIQPFGQGWDSILNKILTLRQQDNAPDDLYYFAVYAPAPTFNQYCSQGCVLGLAPLSTGPGDTYSRAAVGVAYGDADSVLTAVHETGHNHGREHAPCNLGGQPSDPSYPHSGGKIGVWGYDLVTKQLFDPSTPDFMSYCTPPWVSDYTWIGLFDQIKAVNGARVVVPDELLDRTYDRVMLGMNGEVTWLEPLTMHNPPMAEPTTVVLETRSGDQVAEGQLYRYDHLPGGVLLWPRGRDGEGARAARIHVGPSVIRVER